MCLPIECGGVADSWRIPTSPLCSHRVRARVYLNAKTQISCSFQPPNATALPAAWCSACYPARGHGSSGVTLFIYRHPTREVISSTSSGAGAEGNAAPPAPPPSLYKQIFFSSWPHLAGTATAERLPQATAATRWGSPRCLFLSRYLYQGNTAG